MPAQPPAWQQINPPEKQGICFFSVRKLIWLVGNPGEGEDKVEAADRLEEETLLSQHPFMRSVQCIHSPSCSPGKAFFTSLDCGRSQGKQVFLVLAFLNTPHIAYSRIYDSLTKQIVASIKANPWNSGHEFPHFNHTHWLSFLLCSCPLLQLVQRSIAWPCSLRGLQDVSVMWRQLVTGGFQRNSSERILTHFRVELCACDRENSLDISPQASQVRR